MTRLGFGSFTCLCWGLLACPADTSGVDEGTGDGSESGSESGTNPSTDPMTMTDPTDVSADGSSSSGGSADTGPDDTGTETGTGTEGSTTDPDSGSETAGSSDSSSGTPPGGEYPPCMSDDECSDPYTLCWPSEDFGTPNYCTLECESVDDCPVPSSGEAVPVCEGPPDIDICALDCTDGECPDGMTCVEIFMNFERCVYEA